MPKHRGLNLTKFLAAVEQTLLEDYFSSRIEEEQLPERICMNEQHVQQFLEDPTNTAAAGLIIEEFQRVNDLGKGGASTLHRIAKRNGITQNPGETPTTLAMRMFLEHSAQFEEAYTLYAWDNCGSPMSMYSLPSKGFQLTPQRLERFSGEITQWFEGLGKGNQAEVKFYEQEGDTVILVTHGSYVRVLAQWEGNEVKVHAYRPATEDILRYSPAKEVLWIKAPLEKDRKKYVETFAGEVLEGLCPKLSG